MSNLTIQNTQIAYQSLTQISEHKTLLAHSVAKNNGGDDILFKTEDGVYAASGHHLPVDKLEVGSQFDFHGKAAEVIFVDDQENALSDGWRSLKKQSPYLAAGVAAIGVIGGGLAALNGASLMGALSTGAKFAGAQAVFSGVYATATLVHAALRGSETASMEALGQRIQP